MTSYIKDPDAVLDYVVDWSSWLEADDYITDATVTADDDGVTVDSSDHDNTTVTAWISGGTIGDTVGVVFQIVTAGGRTEDRTVWLLIRSR